MVVEDLSSLAANLRALIAGTHCRLELRSFIIKLILVYLTFP